MLTTALEGPDHFINIIDHDMRSSGLPGNVVQLHLHLTAPPDRERLEKRLLQWGTTDPSCKAAFINRWGVPTWTLKDQATPPPLHWHTDVSVQECLDRRVHASMTTATPPLMTLDIVENTDSTVAALTWHHLLADAHGGECMLARLAGSTVGEGQPWRDLSCEPFISRLKAARELLPVFDRIRQGGVASVPADNNNSRLRSSYLTMDTAESSALAAKARDIHPLIGETALCLAGALRLTHELCVRSGEQRSGYLIPMPVSLRASGSHTPILGNPLSFVFIYASAAQLEDSTVTDLARFVADEFVDALKNGYIEACSSQLGLFGYIPAWLSSRILRSQMQGPIASCFFAHTGRTVFDTAPDFDFFGAAVHHVFHRPMVSRAPGLGFFICRHGQRVHVTACTTNGSASPLPRQLLTHILTS